MFLLYPVQSQPPPGAGRNFDVDLYFIIRDSYDKIKKVLYDFWDFALTLWKKLRIELPISEFDAELLLHFC